MLKDTIYILAVIIEIGVPILLAVVFRKKLKVSWAVFFIGLAMFLVSLIRLPLNNYVTNQLKYYFMGNNLLLLAIVFPSLTAAFFEEGFRTLGIGLLIRGRSYEKGLMYGAGHGGGGESMILVGCSLLANFIIYKFFPLFSGAAALKSQFESMSWFIPLIGAGERMLAIIIQVAFSVLVMHAFLNKKYYFILYAFLAHFAIDFLAAYLNVKGQFLWAETAVIIFAAIAITVIFYMKPEKINTQPVQALPDKK